MKKFSKVMLLIAAVLAAAGIGLSAAGAAMGAGSQSTEAMEMLKNRFGDTFDFFFEKEWEDTYRDGEDGTRGTEGTANGDSRVYQAARPEKLEVNLKYDELLLEEYDGSDIRVEVQNDPKALVHVKESGNTLKITSAGKLDKKRKVFVSYPKAMKFREVELGVGAGNVELNGSLYAEKLDVTMGAGEFRNSGTLTTTKTDLEVGAGEMKVTGLTVTELDGQCGVGDLAVEINGKEADYSYRLECGIGDLSVGGEDYSGLGKKHSIDNPGASGEIDLECGIGSVSVTFTGR